MSPLCPHLGMPGIPAGTLLASCRCPLLQSCPLPFPDQNPPTKKNIWHPQIQDWILGYYWPSAYGNCDHQACALPKCLTAPRWPFSSWRPTLGLLYPNLYATWKEEVKALHMPLFVSRYYWKGPTRYPHHLCSRMVVVAKQHPRMAAPQNTQCPPIWALNVATYHEMHQTSAPSTRPQPSINCSEFLPSNSKGDIR